MNKYIEFIVHLRRFLRESSDLKKSRQSIQQRVEQREDNFLSVLKRAIYDNYNSPYRRIIQSARISFQDIQYSVSRSGIEETLRFLKKKGVYLTLDEIKGRKRTIRSGLDIRFKESDFNNPCISPAFYIQSGGTMNGGTGTRTNISFAFLAQRAQHRHTMFDLFSLFEGPVFLWYPTLGGVEMAILLECAKIGKPAAKFFYMVEDIAKNPTFTAKMAFHYLRYIGKTIGVSFPAPENISINEPSEIVKHIQSIMQKSVTLCIRTFVSSAVRIASIAKKNNISLNGVKFWVSGEPLTRGKAQEISDSGAECICQYSFGETGGTVAIGCGDPLFPDDVHLFSDLFAVIQHTIQSDYSERNFEGFLFTTLSLQAPKILLNVENGDYGIVEQRKCTCMLGNLGLTTHIHSIRSFEKFNGEGITIFGCDFIHLIDNVLVPHYGGNSTDYQFIEEHDKNVSSTSLAISPEIGVVDENEVLHRIYKELAISQAYKTQLNLWCQSGTLKIKRIRPLRNRRGKIFPVRLEHVS